MTTVSNPLNKRYVELDSLRGLAALTVFFSHAINMMNLQERPYANLIENSVFHIFWDGAAAVILFFVLSGFVLALPYVGGSGKRIDFVPFVLRRIFRIYPAYYTALAICLLLKFNVFRMDGLHGLSAFITQFWDWPNTDLTLSSLLKHMLLIGPRYEMGQIDPILWSLVVEMRVSLAFPFIIPVIRRVKTFRGALVLLAISAALYKFIPMDTLWYVPLFVLGGLLARFRRPLVEWFGNLSLPAGLAVGGIGIFLYTFRYSVPGMPEIIRYYADYVIGSGVAVLILLVISRPQLSRTLSLKPLRYLGDISYSFYLLHFPILLTVTSQLYPVTQSLKAAWGVSLVISLILPYATYQWVEKPFQEVGRRTANKVKVLLEKAKIRQPGGKSSGNESQLPM